MRSFLNSMLYKYHIATEADDITAQVEEGAAKMNGKSTDEDAGEISLDTNDILGVKEDPNGGTPDQDNGDNNDSDNPDEENGGDDSEGTSDEEGNSSGDDLPEGSDNTNSNDDFTKSRKKNLWFNYRKLHNIIGSAIELISKYVPGVVDVTTIKTLNNIKENLSNAKKKLYDTMTEDFNKLPLEKLINIYIAANYMYDVSSNELEEYFKRAASYQTKK